MIKEIIGRFTPFMKSPAEEEAKEKIIRCTPIARAIVEVISNCDYPYFSNDWGKVSKATHQSVTDCLDILLRYNVKLNDVNLIKEMILEQNNRIFESIIQSVNHHLETIEKAVWGCNKKDVDFETVDKFLKEVDSLNKSDKS